VKKQEEPAPNEAAGVQETLPHALKALEHAEAALRLDPTFLEACYEQARVHLLLDEMYEKRQQPKLSWEHFNKAKELLQRVPASSPYYPLAQRILRSLRPPPLPVAPDDGKGAPPLKGKDAPAPEVRAP
jgi:hypothetical protein